MILGTGIDLIEVARILGAVERFGDRFLARVLLPPEIAYCRSYSRPGPHIAARFAAKEAISKAFGTGIGKQLGWHDMEIARRESGEPYVVLHGKGAELLAARGGGQLHVSLSHTDNYATAIAILEDSPIFSSKAS
ncbi:MAG: holo-ACP synthase [Verrucomicrobiales bacterium]|nr:holo-ACP synthase [Verrucomicrobiales bacterium]